MSTKRKSLSRHIKFLFGNAKSLFRKMHGNFNSTFISFFLHTKSSS